MRKISILSIALLLLTGFAYSQGCIMVRNISGFGQYSLADNSYDASQWHLNMVGRYFKAYRDFKGTKDLLTPEKDRSIVESYSTDITIDHLLNNGWSLELSMPLSSNSRSATKEHGGAGTARHITHSFGLGDVRIVAYKWLAKSSETQKGNIQLGLGVKLPTGDYKYQDYFYKTDSTKVLAPVNGSIQLGDGGTGIVTELNAFYIFNKTFSLYGNCYYLINPREQNGVSTKTGSVATALDLKTGNDVYTVPDIYALRTGVNVNYKKLTASLGLREEGVPIHDLFGGNYGLRRPGFNFSVEPGLTYKMNRSSIYAYVPVNVSRKINQGLSDAKVTELTGVYTVSSGGSGNYQVFVGVLFKL